MGALTIKVTGFKEMAEALRGLGDDKVATKIVKKNMLAAAQSTVEKAKANLLAHNNIRSHLLINSIGATTSTKNGQVIIKVGVLQKFTEKQRSKREIEIKSRADQSGSDYAFYGKFLELGNAHESAQPFLLPAMDSEKENFLEMFGTGLKADLDREVEARKVS